MSAEKIDLTISIVNFNTRDFLSQCLDSIYSTPQDNLSLEVCVVDNASTDGSAGMVGSDFPQARLIRHADNPGYGRANNEALKKVESRYCLVLNPDVIVTPESLSEMVKFLDANQDVGVVGCRLLNTDGSLQFSCRRFPSIATIALRGIGMYRLFPNASIFRRYFMSDWDHDSVADVDWIMGSCMMFRTSALRDVDFFDGNYFMYYEDVDICFRIWKKWKVCYYPLVQMPHHHVQQSHKLASMNLRFIHAKSVLRFFVKHGFFAKREDAIRERELAQD